MYRVFSFSLICFFAMGIAYGRSTDNAPTEDLSYRNAPREMLELWLHFHEADLFLGMNATFEFSRNGMKVHCLVEDKKDFQKLQEMLEPYRRLFQIELDVAYPPATEKPDEDNYENDPPPSLWENYELRYNLGDPVAQAKDRPEFERLRSRAFLDDLLKRRLYLYAVQILEWNKKMERYASGLHALAQVVYDPEIEPDIRKEANSVCLAHAHEMEKLLEKLQSNLSQAIPKSGEKDSSGSVHKSSAPKSVIDTSVQIADAARVVARRIRHFIYPEQFTVGLDELREPSLLDSLKNLSGMDSDFQAELGRFGRKIR